MDMEQREAVKKRVPECCPFCVAIEKVTWKEFEVIAGRKYYVDEKGINNSWDKPIISVFCTRCKEEVRKEDI